MAQPQQQPIPTTPVANAYIPVIRVAEDSRLIVLNDNCIITLDALLSIAGIGKVLSHRGHELYTLYNADGGIICTFEGTGLMQRTCVQIDEITRKHASRLKELQETPRDTHARLEALERMVDAVWFMPNMPGAKQAQEDFVARRLTLGTELDASKQSDSSESRSSLDSSESREFLGFDDAPSSSFQHTV